MPITHSHAQFPRPADRSSRCRLHFHTPWRFAIKVLHNPVISIEESLAINRAMDRLRVYDLHHYQRPQEQRARKERPYNKQEREAAVRSSSTHNLSQSSALFTHSTGLQLRR